MKDYPRLSIAIPVYNEESIIPELLSRTAGVLDSIPGGPHEIVVVDDGSSDDTFALLEEASTRDSRIVCISLSRNFGHQAAFSAALDHVTGDAVVLMDGDLQDSPEVIPQFIEAYLQGYDVVYAVRIRRKEGVLKRFCYYMFYRIITGLADIKLPVGAGDFALISRRIVDLLRNAPERHRYLRGLRTWVGFRQIGVPVEREARHSGDSKYSLRKLFTMAFDGIFAFSAVPIRAATSVGFLAVVVSVAFAAYSLYAKLFWDRSPRGFTALIFATTFLAGVQLLFLGVIGEYVGRIYNEVKQRPIYIVKKIVGR